MKQVLEQNPVFIVFIVLLSLANWSLEILKWKNLSGHIRFIAFAEATKQSLAALTASLLTPNRIGEYGAKALYYQKTDRKKVMALNFLGNFYQMLVTVIFGFFSLFYLKDQLFVFLKYSLLLLFLPGLFLIVRSFYKETPASRFYLKFLIFARGIPIQIHLSNFAISIGRYLIFSHQFYFLLVLFGINLDYTLAIALIGAMYFLASVIPGFVALDFLIKGSVALTLFGFYGVPENLILTSDHYHVADELCSYLPFLAAISFCDSPIRHLLKYRANKVIPAAIFIFTLYAILLLVYIFGYAKLEEVRHTESVSDTCFSIIVPFRNEQENLPNLLKSIANLNYDQTFFEVLLVDDQSDDHSVEVIRDFKAGHPQINLELIDHVHKPGSSAKKSAIETAIKKSSYDWILTTDADCMLPKSWLGSFQAAIQKNDPVMLAGPVENGIRFSRSFCTIFRTMSS
ncbi:MAG: glycosyltransferase [Flavobacteriaceae bacterium]|nr:glycosyltransferase [Flavobacteriaceae bacterium]